MDEETYGLNQAKAGSYATMMRIRPAKNGKLQQKYVGYATTIDLSRHSSPGSAAFAGEVLKKSCDFSLTKLREQDSNGEFDTLQIHHLTATCLFTG